MKKKGKKVNGIRDVLLQQGLYFVAAGLWPLLHMRSFLKVTGPKRDLWLVDTVGLLVAAIGSVLTEASLQTNVPSGVLHLAKRSAAALLAVEIVFVAKKRISPIYLADALVEAFFIKRLRSLEKS